MKQLTDTQKKGSMGCWCRAVTRPLRPIYFCGTTRDVVFPGVIPPPP